MTGMHVKNSARLVALVAAATLLLLALARPAFAHTELVFWGIEPDPATGGQQLRLRYSEPIDGRFLTVSLLDMEGNVIQSGGVTVDPGRRTDGLVSLEGVTPGLYTVAWWTRALDGDPSNGSFILGYQTQVTPAALLPPVGARDPALQPAMFWEDTVWDTLLHWWAYLATALLLGSLGFALLTWRPGWNRFVRTGGATVQAEADHLDYDASRSYRLIALSGAGLFLTTSLILLVLQVGFVRYSLLQPVTSSTPTPLGPSTLAHETPIHALGQILSGHNGHVWIARMVTGVAALLLAILPSPRRRQQNWRWLLAFVAGTGAAFTISLSAHAAVIPQSGWARFLDWAHLVVMSTWIGGLLPLLLTVRRIRRLDGGRHLYFDLAAGVAGRFSTFALGAFIFMAVTGVAEAYLHVGEPGLLAPTIYGRALIAKLALFALLFGFGAVHRRWSLRALKAETHPAAAREAAAGGAESAATRESAAVDAEPAAAAADGGLRPAAFGADPTKRTFIEKVLPFEFATGLCLLVAVALMASLGTSKAVWPAHQKLGYYAASTTSDVTATFRAVPGKAGENAVALDITDRRLGPPTVGSGATITVAGTPVDLQPVGTLAAGTTQRFAAASVAELPETQAMCAYTYERPSYPVVQGKIYVVIPAAATGPAK
jgi:copper transport protein